MGGTPLLILSPGPVITSPREEDHVLVSGQKQRRGYRRVARVARRASHGDAPVGLSSYLPARATSGRRCFCACAPATSSSSLGCVRGGVRAGAKGSESIKRASWAVADASPPASAPPPRPSILPSSTALSSVPGSPTSPPSLLFVPLHFSPFLPDSSPSLSHPSPCLLYPSAALPPVDPYHHHFFLGHVPWPLSLWYGCAAPGHPPWRPPPRHGRGPGCSA